ncbi:MAG: hypothetical protein A2Y10_07910 [Planctomycetes bacterium GWF2_41_51]|nr:MAG: hypothetical protein A2Y10_07910 [Planctomycetes bacterium GWF2_41_51]
MPIFLTHREAADEVAALSVQDGQELQLANLQQQVLGSVHLIHAGIHRILVDDVLSTHVNDPLIHEGNSTIIVSIMIEILKEILHLDIHEQDARTPIVFRRMPGVSITRKNLYIKMFQPTEHIARRPFYLTRVYPAGITVRGPI